MTHWIGVASRDHVIRAVAGGFAQVNHGKAAPLMRMKRGDHLLYYSPKERMRAGELVQAFTAGLPLIAIPGIKLESGR